jgi:hypothetical protein
VLEFFVSGDMRQRWGLSGQPTGVHVGVKRANTTPRSPYTRWADRVEFCEKLCGAGGESLRSWLMRG